MMQTEIAERTTRARIRDILGVVVVVFHPGDTGFTAGKRVWCCV